MKLVQPTALFRENSMLSRRRAQAGFIGKIRASSRLGPNAMPGGPIVFDGDSLTYGSGATSLPAKSYPNQMVGLLGSDWTMDYNAGVAGQSIAQMESDASTEIDTRYSASRKNNVLFAWGGTNDIILGASAATLQTRIQTYVQNRIAAGWTVFFLTILPRQEMVDSPSLETIRQTVNTWIRANVPGYGATLVDVAADSRIGDIGDEQGPYFDTDHIHLNDSGYLIVAGLGYDKIRATWGLTR